MKVNVAVMYLIMIISSKKKKKEIALSIFFLNNTKTHAPSFSRQLAQNHHTVIPMAHRNSTDNYSLREEIGNATPDMEGWLHKQGCKYKKWNKRWFVLKGPNLFYFKSPKVSARVHVLFLETILLI